MSTEALKSFFDIGTVVLLFLTFTFGTGALITGNIINKRQEEKLQQFGLDVAEANRRAAEANQKAEEEHLARARIEDKLAGWKLDAGAQARIIEKLNKYKGTPFDLGANPAEVAFMETIDSILLAAGWNREIPKADNPLLNILLNSKARINYVSGFYVEIAQPTIGRFGPAAEALVTSLRAEGIPAQGQVATKEQDDTRIHIVIGSK